MSRVPVASALLALAPAPLAAEEILFRCFFDGVCDPDRMTCEGSGLDVRFKVDTETSAVERLGGEPTSAFGMIRGDRALTVLEVRSRAAPSPPPFRPAAVGRCTATTGSPAPRSRRNSISANAQRCNAGGV